MGSTKKSLAAFLIFFNFTIFPAPAQNSAQGTASLVSEISRLEELTRSAANTAERLDAFISLARLYRLCGDADAVIKTYESAIAAFPDNGRVLLEQGRFFISTGDYEKAAVSLNGLLTRSRETSLLVEGRYYSSLLEAFRTGNTRLLESIAFAPEFAAYRSGIYYTLWKLTSVVSWKNRLAAEFPQSPEARIAAGEAESAPTPQWLLFSGRSAVNFSAAETAPAAPAPAANSAPQAQVSASPQTLLQTGLFSREENARAMAENLREAGFEPLVVIRRVNGNDFWAVGINSGDDTGALIARLKNSGFDAFPVR